jgi:hypothetical protein
MMLQDSPQSAATSNRRYLITELAGGNSAIPRKSSPFPKEFAMTSLLGLGVYPQSVLPKLSEIGQNPQIHEQSR